MTKYNLVWNGLPYVSFDDYTTIPESSRKDIEKLLHLTGARRNLGSSLAPHKVDDRFTNYSFFITISMKSIVDTTTPTYYQKLVKWMYANQYITDYAFYLEYYADKKNLHCHGVFNSIAQHDKIKKGIRLFTKTFYKDTTVPKTAILLRRISEYKLPSVENALNYCRKDVSFMEKHNIKPMEKIHSNTITI